MTHTSYNMNYYLYSELQEELEDAGVATAELFDEVFGQDLDGTVDQLLMFEPSELKVLGYEGEHQAALVDYVFSELELDDDSGCYAFYYKI